MLILQISTNFSKNVKSDIFTNYIYFNNREIIITTNKAAAFSDLNIVEKYVKELSNIDLNNTINPCLFQSKLYLKILGVFYFLENTNLSIISNIIKTVIKKAYIFNDITLASHSCIIKAFPKSDIAVIWIDIWNS